jgi:hypothetical protein
MTARKLPEHASLPVAPALSYRVTFFTRTSEDSFYAAESWTHEDAKDIREVLAWADEHAHGAASVAVYAEVDDGAGDTILILLGGEDPTRGISVSMTAQTHGT